MRAGRLRHRVVIEQVTENRDAYGAISRTWETFAEVWASIEPISGREYFTAKEMEAETTARIRLRYLSGVTAKMRAVHGSDVYDIESVINTNEANRELVLMCKRGLSDG